jgi:hypothetical protein
MRPRSCCVAEIPARVGRDPAQMSPIAQPDVVELPAAPIDDAE